jgi:hypothetical protein
MRFAEVNLSMTMWRALLIACALTLCFSVVEAEESSIAWRVPQGRTASDRVDAGAVFDAVGVSWSGAVIADVRVRVSADGQEWSGWASLPLDGDLTDPSSGHFLTSIHHFDSSSHFVEYQVSQPVENLTLTFFRPAEPRPSRATTGNLQFGTVAIRSRLAWGCPDGEDSRWTPAYTRVTHAVVHHTAGANAAVDWDAEVRGIWYYHTLTNGWGDVGYNFLIAPDGVIYEGRAGGNGAIGAHFSCRNSNTIGVALLGTFSTSSPTSAALASLKRLLGEIATMNGIDPAASLRHPSSGLTLPTILGHRDGNVPGATCTITECPGDVLYAMLPALRSDLACRPLIETPPAVLTIKAGESASLSVTARGDEPLSFQWYSDDTAIEGATRASITVTPAETTHYRVRVTNRCGTVDSRPSSVTVSPFGRDRRRAIAP